MSKTVNILFYKKGYFGTLIKFLMSLHPESYPFYPINEVFDITKPRKEYLRFDLLRWKYGEWIEFHKAYGGCSIDRYGTCIDFDNFENSNYNNLTIFGHAKEIEHFLSIHHKRLLSYKVNYISTVLNKPYDIIVEDFLNDNYWAVLTPDDIKMHNRLEHKFNPYMINLDNIVTGTNNFVKEYIKLNEYCGSKYVINDALEIYKGWVKSRKLNKYDFYEIN
jgi:hypothetical protein